MTELINRPEYLTQLIQNKDVDLVKIVTGIRRCGKSSLLDLFHQYLSDSGVSDSHIIHMNLESLRYRELSDYLTFYDYVSERISGDGKTYRLSNTGKKPSNPSVSTSMWTFILQVLTPICCLRNFLPCFLAGM